MNFNHTLLLVLHCTVFFKPSQHFIHVVIVLTETTTGMPQQEEFCFPIFTISILVILYRYMAYLMVLVCCDARKYRHAQVLLTHSGLLVLLVAAVCAVLAVLPCLLCVQGPFQLYVVWRRELKISC